MWVPYAGYIGLVLRRRPDLRVCTVGRQGRIPVLLLDAVRACAVSASPPAVRHCCRRAVDVPGCPASLPRLLPACLSELVCPGLSMQSTKLSDLA